MLTVNLCRVSLLCQVVIKYVPYVGDSKRAMDEYTSEIMMGGLNTIALHNTCEVSINAFQQQNHHEIQVEAALLRRGSGATDPDDNPSF